MITCAIHSDIEEPFIFAIHKRVYTKEDQPDEPYVVLDLYAQGVNLTIFLNHKDDVKNLVKKLSEVL